MDNVILIAFQLPGRHFLRESNKMLFKIHLSRSADRKMNKKKTKQKKLQALNGRNYNGCSVQDLFVLLKESEACVRQILFSLPLVMILDCFAKPST